VCSSDLNIDNRGEYLGVFTSEDKILAVYKDGTYELTDNELTNKYDGRELLFIQKYYPSLTINAVHYDPDAKSTLVKRFKIETATLNRKFSFISDGRGAKLWVASTFPNPEIEFSFVDGRGVKQHQKVLIGDFIDVKGWKAMGNKLTQEKVKSVKLCSPLTHIPEVDSEETWNDNSNDPISPEEPVLKAPPPPEKKDFPPFMPKIEKEKQKTKNLDDDGTDTLGQKTLF
jgi:topoisomerase-4 subunit A